MAIIKEVVQPFVTDLVHAVMPLTPSPLGGGFYNQVAAVTAITSTVTFGVMSNVPSGSGYGYAERYSLGTDGRACGSNPSPTTLDVGGQTFNHLQITESSQYQWRNFAVEIPHGSNYSNQPTSSEDWLNTVTISDGAGNDFTFDTSDSDVTQNSAATHQYYKNGTWYRKQYLVHSGAPNYTQVYLIDSTNNNKTITWDFA